MLSSSFNANLQPTMNDSRRVMDSVFGTDKAIHGPKKKSENGLFSQRIVFTLPLGFTDVFGRRSCPKCQKKELLRLRS